MILQLWILLLMVCFFFFSLRMCFCVCEERKQGKFLRNMYIRIKRMPFWIEWTFFFFISYYSHAYWLEPIRIGISKKKSSGLLNKRSNKIEKTSLVCFVFLISVLRKMWFSTPSINQQKVFKNSHLLTVMFVQIS